VVTPVCGSRSPQVWSRLGLVGTAGQAQAVRPVGEHVHGVRDAPGREGGREAVGVFGRDVGVLSAVCQMKNGGEPGVTSASSEVDRRSSGLALSPSKISRAGR